MKILLHVLSTSDRYEIEMCCERNRKSEKSQKAIRLFCGRRKIFSSHQQRESHAQHYSIRDSVSLHFMLALSRSIQSNCISFFRSSAIPSALIKLFISFFRYSWHHLAHKCLSYASGLNRNSSSFQRNSRLTHSLRCWNFFFFAWSVKIKSFGDVISVIYVRWVRDKSKQNKSFTAATPWWRKALRQPQINWFSICRWAFCLIYLLLFVYLAFGQCHYLHNDESQARMFVFSFDSAENQMKLKFVANWNFQRSNKTK